MTKISILKADTSINNGHVTADSVSERVLLISDTLQWNVDYLNINTDSIHHDGYETNKCHVNQADFAPPTKFVNIFASERKNLLCALKCQAITKAVKMGVS